MIDLQEERMKVPAHVVRYVESELNAYRTYKITAAELGKDVEDIKNHSRQFDPSKVTSKNQMPGEPVGITVLRLTLTEEKLKQQLGRIRKIEAGLQLLNPEAKALVEKKYFSGVDYTNEEIIVQFRLNRNHYYKMRNEILYKFAVVFGVW